MRSGRAARQVRRIGREAETARTQATLQRERDLLARQFQRNIALPLQIRQSLLGIQAPEATLVQSPQNLLGPGLLGLANITAQNPNFLSSFRGTSSGNSGGSGVSNVFSGIFGGGS